MKPHPLLFSRDLIKEPGFTFLYPNLKELFPNGKFVMVVRDPRENIRSILDRHKLPGHHRQLSGEQLQDISPEWKQVLYGSWMGLEGDTYIDMLAARWKAAAQVYLNHSERIELIRYEDFCAGKVEAIRELADRLCLPQEKEIRDDVDTKFQPRGSNRGVQWTDFFGDENLARIESYCRPEMEKIGYN
ncbi:sulfotransferase [Salinibacter ruber]|uniref:sulfotransferase n=1 Tax=Salinibacter ruber TaxID=146919 RepID=UPI002167C9FC